MTVVSARGVLPLLKRVRGWLDRLLKGARRVHEVAVLRRVAVGARVGVLRARARVLLKVLTVRCAVGLE